MARPDLSSCGDMAIASAAHLAACAIAEAGRLWTPRQPQPGCSMLLTTGDVIHNLVNFYSGCYRQPQENRRKMVVFYGI